MGHGLRPIDALTSPNNFKKFSANVARRQGLTEFLLVSALSFLLLLLILARTRLLTPDNPAYRNPIDHFKYIYMAAHTPLSFHIAPFCWRVAVPLLAHFLPFGLQLNFLLIDFSSLWFTAILIYYLGRWYSLSRLYCTFGLLLFLSIGLLTKGVLSDFWLADSLALFLTTLAVYLALSARPLPFALVLACGVATREPALLVGPLFYSLNARKLIDVSLLKVATAVLTPAVFTLVMLHLLIPAKNGDANYVRSLPYRDIMVANGSTADPDTLHTVLVRFVDHVLNYHVVFLNIQYVVAVTSVLVTLLAILGAINCREVALRYSPFVLLTFASMFVFGDVRHLEPMVPVLVILALLGARSLERPLRVPIQDWMALPVSLILLNLVWLYKDSASRPAQAVVIVGYLGIALGARVYRGRPKREALSV